MKWRAVKASQVLKALLSSGWSVKRRRGSHIILMKRGKRDFIFAFHNKEEIGPKMLSRIAKHTDLTPDEL